MTLFPELNKNRVPLVHSLINHFRQKEVSSADGEGLCKYRILFLFLLPLCKARIGKPLRLSLSTHTTTFACAWKVKPSLELVLSHIVVMRTRRRLLVLIA